MRDLLIDIAKFILISLALLYGWYILISLPQLQPLTLEEKVYIQQEQISYAYYLLIGLIAIFAIVLDNIYYKKGFTPTYTKPYTRINLSIALSFSLIFILLTIFHVFTTGLKPITAIVFSIPLAIISALKGIIENMFFIGLIGFGLWYILSRGYRTATTAVISAMIVGIIAVSWHLYKLFYIYSIAGPANILPVALSIYTFFFVGSLISFVEDRTWTWDIVHFLVNFTVGIIGSKAYVII